MFGGGVDPTGALKLIDLPEALYPGRVDQILFRPLVRITLARRHGEGHILVNGISDECRALIGSVGSGEWMAARAIGPKHLNVAAWEAAMAPQAVRPSADAS